MFTRDDLIDAIVRHLQPQRVPAMASRPEPAPAPASAPSPDKRVPAFSLPGPKGKIFVSEYEIKRMLTGGRTRLTLPRDAIISPLAVDWLVLKGIEVVRE